MKINDTKAFGDAIRTRRKELGYTQAYLSECSGLSASFISNLENGKETVEIGKAMRVAQLLALDLTLEVRG
ncbi:MAG: helix-turn-helix domain-containing protein [Eubacterium sp.]|nr:helix-turn-helix domain-containing protein [Eubacterium sp.]